MMMQQSRLTMPGLCAGCGAPVMCDDPDKVQSLDGVWWHASCRRVVQAAAHEYDARLAQYIAPRPIDPVNVFIWGIFVPLSVVIWLGLIIWILFFA